MIKFNIEENIGHLSYAVIEGQLFYELKKLNLLSRTGLTIKTGHLGMTACDVLITTWETTRIPTEWIKYAKYYKLIVVGSEWNLKIFKNAGIDNVICLPFGIDNKFYEAKICDDSRENSFLFFANNQVRKGFESFEQFWIANHRNFYGFKLILVGRNINAKCLTYLKSEIKANFKITYFLENVVLYEPLKRLDTSELINLYRHCHTLVLPSKSEGFGLTVLEALCCGCNVVIPEYSSTNEFNFENIFKFKGDQISDNGAELGYGFNGEWWTPSWPSLLDCMRNSIDNGTLNLNQIICRSEQINKTYNWVVFLNSLVGICEAGEKDNMAIYRKENKKIGKTKIFLNKIKFKISRWLNINV